MRPARRAQVEIHICVALWGFTAILGKLISLGALPLVWWRVVIVVLALLALPRVRHGLFGMRRRLALAYAGVGVLVSLHWLSFYGAIKLANASVAAISLASAPIFLAFIEPWIVGRPFDLRELFWGAAAMPGVVLVVGGIPIRMRQGLGMGVVSAVLAALFGSMNKRLVSAADPLVITFIEL